MSTPKIDLFCAKIDLSTGKIEFMALNLIQIRLKPMLYDLGMTQKALAQKTGYTAQHIGRIANGAAWPNRECLTKICRVLGCQPGDLLVLKEESDGV